MSALVLGKRSTTRFFEDLHHPATGGGGAAATTPSPPPSSSKRARLGASSPQRPISFPCPAPTDISLPSPSSDGAAVANNIRSACNNGTPIDHLRSLFPDMDEQLLVGALEASASNLDFAIRSLKELCLGSTERCLQSAVCNPVEGIDAVNLAGILRNTSEIGASENPPAMGNLPADGSEWVELLVSDIMKATDVDDARVRASRLLEILEKCIMNQTTVGVVQTLHNENVMLREQVEGLLHDNTILKRAVAIQHERQKELDERSQEVQHLKQLLAQYQEQLRTLEINNYALSMHLRQAQQGSSIPGRFHPDVF